MFDLDISRTKNNINYEYLKLYLIFVSINIIRYSASVNYFSLHLLKLKTFFVNPFEIFKMFLIRNLMMKVKMKVKVFLKIIDFLFDFLSFVSELYTYY